VYDRDLAVAVIVGQVVPGDTNLNFGLNRSDAANYRYERAY
jgi:hypothetical protein